MNYSKIIRRVWPIVILGLAVIIYIPALFDPVKNEDIDSNRQAQRIMRYGNCFVHLHLVETSWAEHKDAGQKLDRFFDNHRDEKERLIPQDDWVQDDRYEHGRLWGVFDSSALKFNEAASEYNQHMKRINFACSSPDKGTHTQTAYLYPESFGLIWGYWPR